VSVSLALRKAAKTPDVRPTSTTVDGHGATSAAARTYASRTVAELAMLDGAAEYPDVRRSAATLRPASVRFIPLTRPVPTKADDRIALRDAAQPGSRIYYISSAQGNDRTGEIYFWDGSQIIDSSGRPKDANGVAYGTDPMNPSVAVKPFKRWAYVGPRRDPKRDIGTPGALGSAFAAFRGGFPDWWLFHRGETFDLKADLTSFAQETNPTAVGGGGALTLSGGRSPSERQVMGAYGDVCQARPRFIHPTDGFVTRFAGYP
jgi:hypothetical protein